MHLGIRIALEKGGFLRQVVIEHGMRRLEKHLV